MMMTRREGRRNSKVSKNALADPCPILSVIPDHARNHPEVISVIGLERSNDALIKWLYLRSTVWRKPDNAQIIKFD